jgi:hypothetical protein
MQYLKFQNKAGWGLTYDTSEVRCFCFTVLVSVIACASSVPEPAHKQTHSDDLVSVLFHNLLLQNVLYNMCLSL